mgnify:CR=1 FL=1
MQAKPLENALSVKSVETLPDGVKVVTLDCRDCAAFGVRWNTMERFSVAPVGTAISSLFITGVIKKLHFPLDNQ